MQLTLTGQDEGAASRTCGSCAPAVSADCDSTTAVIAIDTNALGVVTPPMPLIVRRNTPLVKDADR